MPSITFQSSRLSSVLPKKKPTAHSSGLSLIPQEVTKEFTHFIRGNDLHHLTFHGLRHANATLQLAAGINREVVSEGLGHSNISITLDLYSHVLLNMQQHAADAVANLLKRE